MRPETQEEVKGWDIYSTTTDATGKRERCNHENENHCTGVKERLRLQRFVHTDVTWRAINLLAWKAERFPTKVVTDTALKVLAAHLVMRQKSA